MMDLKKFITICSTERLDFYGMHSLYQGRIQKARLEGEG